MRVAIALMWASPIALSIARRVNIHNTVDADGDEPTLKQLGRMLSYGGVPDTPKSRDDASSPTCDTPLLVTIHEGNAITLHLPQTLQPDKNQFVITDWKNWKAFTKDYVDSDGRHCSKTAWARCDEKGIVRDVDCQGIEHNSTFSCIGPSRSCYHAYRASRFNEGEEAILNLPSRSRDNACPYQMASGYVKFELPDFNPVYINVARSWPSADDVADVAAWAARVAGQDSCGSEAMLVLTGKWADTAKTLLKLAELKRAEADEEDSRDLQALYQLWTMNLYERHAQTMLSTTRHIMTRLASDFRDVASGNPVKENKKALVALSHFYQQGAPRLATQKKRVLIFSCTFGGGHMSAAKAVAGYFDKDRFEPPTIINTSPKEKDDLFYDDVTASFEWAFNEIILKRQNYKVFNKLDKLHQWMALLKNPCPSPECNNDRKHAFRLKVIDERPDLIVTVYHMDVLPVLEIAKELGNIPMLHLATDMDIKMHEIFSQSVRPIYPKFFVGVPFPLAKSFATTAPLAESQTFVSGYPVRKSFLAPFDSVAALNEKLKLVPGGTKVMLIMTGGGGQDVGWPYKLAKRGIPGMNLHIIIIAGGNNDLEENLKAAMPGRRQFPDENGGEREVLQGSDKKVTVEVAKDPDNKDPLKPYFVFEKRLALLMDIADVVLSKPGGGSTAEIAYRGVPALFDVSITLFHWEQFTVDAFVDEGRGLSFKNEAEFRQVLPQAMRMERSQQIAIDKKTGEIIDPAVRVAEAADRLIDTRCGGCRLLAGT